MRCPDPAKHVQPDPPKKKHDFRAVMVPGSGNYLRIWCADCGEWASATFSSGEACRG
jgi:hypothetical protein